MKLRYFKDPNVYFMVYALEDNNIHEIKSIKNNKFETIKDAIIECRTNPAIIKEILDNKYPEIDILMKQTSSNRINNSGNILHFCDSAVITFDTEKFNIIDCIFDFRKTIDPTLEYATYNAKNNKLYYNGKAVAMDYFKDDCMDKELCNFILHDQTIVY